jgi:hypothetical protein
MSETFDNNNIPVMHKLPDGFTHRHDFALPRQLVW